jgi:hypothetical protein
MLVEYQVPMHTHQVGLHPTIQCFLLAFSSSFSASASKEEAQQVFIENYEQIFSVINERYVECENAPKPVRKGK